MATSSRLRGNITPVFTIGGVSYADDLKSVSLTSKDKDDSDLTFYEASQGLGKDWTLKLKTVVSFDTDSLYGYLWDSTGTDVAVVYGPYGNVAATPTQPHFTFTVTLPGKPDLERDASTDTTGAAVEVEITVVGDITKRTAA